jgi:hypothetical protein
MTRAQLLRFGTAATLVWLALSVGGAAAIAAGARGVELSRTTVFYVWFVLSLLWLFPLFCCVSAARRGSGSLVWIVVAYVCGVAACAIPVVGALASLMVLVAACHPLVQSPAPPLR